MHALNLLQSKILFGSIAGTKYSLIWMLVRNIQSEIPVSVVGRIDHGTHIIHSTCHYRIILSYRNSINIGANDGSEDIRRHKHILIRQSVRSELDKFSDDLRFVHTLGFFIGVGHIVHTLFGTESDIVELDFIKTCISTLLRHLYLILPGFTVIGINPCHTGGIVKYRSVIIVV